MCIKFIPTKWLGVLLLFSIPVVVFSQKPLKKFDGKKVVQLQHEYDNGDEETYYVLKNDQDKLFGPYQVVISCGNGIKGTYKNNKPVGKWTFANHDGTFQEYDFDTEAFLFRGFEDKPGVAVFPVKVETFDTTKLEAEPTIIGGRDRLQHRLQTAAYVAADESLPEDPSFCTYLIYVDKEGKFSHYEITHKPADQFVGLCHDAIESVKNLKYFPMIYDGQPVDSAIEITIYFPGEDFRKQGYTIPDNRVHPF